MSDSMKWISVDDGQPEKTGNVIVFANDIVTSWVEVLSAYVCPEYGNVIFEQLDGEDYPPIVTHWMPLPDAPEQTNN